MENILNESLEFRSTITSHATGLFKCQQFSFKIPSEIYKQIFGFLLE